MRSYEHFSKGDVVRIAKTWRTPVTVSGPQAYKEWIDHQAGVVGRIVSMTNAGFRGLEYAVQTDEGCAYSISAGDLELVTAAPLAPWSRQVTYRGSETIRSAR